MTCVAGIVWSGPAPGQWRASGRSGGQLPANTVESLVMGKITNRGSAKVNLKGGWIVVPFSRGVHTKYEGEWERMVGWCTG